MKEGMKDIKGYIQKEKNEPVVYNTSIQRTYFSLEIEVQGDEIGNVEVIRTALEGADDPCDGLDCVDKVVGFAKTTDGDDPCNEGIDCSDDPCDKV